MTTTSTSTQPRTGARPHPAYRVLTMFARVSVAAVLIGFLVRHVDWSQLDDVNIGFVVLGIVLLAASYVVAAIKWRFHLPPDLRMGVRNACGLYFLGLFWNNFLPSSVGGDIVRGWRAAQGRRSKIVSYSSVLADRVTSAIVMFGFGTIAVAVDDYNLPSSVTLAVVTGFGGAIVAAALLMRRSPHLVQMRRPSMLAGAILLGAVVQMLQIGVNASVLASVTGSPHVGLLATAIPIAAALSLVPISLNGLGIREGTLFGILVAGGIPRGDAAATVVLALAVLVLVSVPGGVYHAVTHLGRAYDSSTPTVD